MTWCLLNLYSQEEVSMIKTTSLEKAGSVAYRVIQFISGNQMMIFFPQRTEGAEDVEQMDSLFPYGEKTFLHLAKIY